jgi:hypothetical protein
MSNHPCRPLPNTWQQRSYTRNIGGYWDVDANAYSKQAVDYRSKSYYFRLEAPGVSLQPLPPGKMVPTKAPPSWPVVVQPPFPRAGLLIETPGTHPASIAHLYKPVTWRAQAFAARSARISRQWHSSRPNYINYTILDSSSHNANTTDRANVSIHSDGQVYSNLS